MISRASKILNLLIIPLSLAVLVLISHQGCALLNEEFDIDEKDVQTEEVAQYFNEKQQSREKTVKKRLYSLASYNRNTLVSEQLYDNFIITCFLKLFILFLSLIIFF